MGFSINHNMMAIRTGQQLNQIYGRLSKNTERLSSGLRVNSASDDAAGFAIRELMRADIEVLNQGIRNAADAISLLQTAEGALGVMDEKLTRMKELAEQAASGTYTTAQRELINSEYQAMAAEIDRIANATDFNGVKLLDGSLLGLHDGSGLKVHFGLGNNRAEDYFFINLCDVRATSSSGLRVGISDPQDIWRSTSLNVIDPAAPLSQTALQGGSEAGLFGLQYSSGLDPNGNPTPCGGPGVWSMYGYVSVDPACENLSDIVHKINQGAQAQGSFRVSSSTVADLDGRELIINGQTYKFDSSAAFDSSAYKGSQEITTIGLQGVTSTTTAMKSLAVMVNEHYSSSGVFAATNGSTVEMFATQFGVKGNEINISSNSPVIRSSGPTLRGGGASAMSASLSWDESNQEYELQLTMKKGGDRYQLRIFSLTSLAGGGSVIGEAGSSVGYLGYLPTRVDDSTSHIANYKSTDESSEWQEVQNGSGRSNWDGSDILSQSGAQKSIGALEEAILRKDNCRARLGAYINRLENTITNLQIQVENLQMAESRISDIDVATEMTDYSRNNILAQTATAMLAQANAFPELALQLLGR